MSTKIEDLTAKFVAGFISGADLSRMVEMKELSKSERRKITKMTGKMKKVAEVKLSERQKKRLEVKDKKSLPKLSKEDRRKKFQKDLDCDREKEAANFTVCLGCKKRGHFVKNCPKIGMCIPINDVNVDEICFNCGSSDHTLKNCKQSRSTTGILPFANCFVCKKVGHISRDCPENPNGLYPKGGCCHICLQKTHLVKDCPERTEEDKLKFLARKKDEDERDNGVCVDGLTFDGDKYAGGDDTMVFNDDNDENSDDNDGKDTSVRKERQKSKKEKSGKKRKSIM